MKCIHCCFKNRKDKNLSMPLEMYKSGMSQFHKLGTRAVEITGGGDPTLYEYINEILEFLHSLSFHIGVNTNGLEAKRVDLWKLCDWVRISMNVFDYYEDIDISHIRNSGTKISTCYIWNQLSTFEILEKVVRWSNENKIPCRIAPDCIIPLEKIDMSLETIFEMLNQFKNNEYVFLSDFNISTTRHNQNCFVHMIKPCFYTDGNVYACPSAELAYEHDSQIQAKTKICSWENILDFYTSSEATKPKTIDCSYCKYAKQQILLEETLMETTFNDFA